MLHAAPIVPGPGIVVWTLAVDDIPASLWDHLTALLDDGERAWAARFACDRHRLARLAAHALKRLMLQAFAGRPAGSWRFDTAPGGKPRVTVTGTPHFNLAYSAGWVACGISDHVDLGIDLEHTARQAPLTLSGTYLTAEEERWLKRLPAPAQSDGFLRLWTLKEAFTKAVGTGLMQDWQDFGFSFDPLRVTFRDATLGDCRRWHFDQRRIGEAFFLAVAWRDGPRGLAVTVEHIRLEQVVGGGAHVVADTGKEAVLFGKKGPKNFCQFGRRLVAIRPNRPTPSIATDAGSGISSIVAINPVESL